MKKSNLWTQGTPKEVVRGVVAWENCLEVPEGIIESMNEDVDKWKEEQATSNKQSESAKSLYNANGPIRFDPEQEFRKEVHYKFLRQIQSNSLNKAAQYFEIFPDVEREINWMEKYQYITYRPPKHMEFHSDNHSVRNPKTNKFYIAPYMRRITILTYLNDDFMGGALSFRYFPETDPYKPPAGSVVIMPSSYIYSHATTPLLNGRKAAFLVSLSSNFDMDSYNSGRPLDEVKARELS